MNTRVLILISCVVAASLAARATVPPIVGLDFVGRGVDVTTMELGLSQITENTYTTGMKWTNGINKKTYTVPDQMFAQTMTFSNYSTSTNSFDGIQDMQVWQYTHHSWHSGFLGMDSHSKTTYQFLERFYTQDQSLARSSLDVGFLRLTAPTFPPLTTTKMFELSVEMLPSTCCGNPSDYAKFREFFTSFGTAFMDSAELGGTLVGHTWYAKCLLNVNSKSWVNEQSGWNFAHIIGEGRGHHTSHNNASKDFTHCAVSNTTFFGGNSTGLYGDDWSSWVDTVFDKPYPMSFTLQPISTLVMDMKKATAIDTAMQQYLQDAQTALQKTEASMAKHDPHNKPSCCDKMKLMRKRS